MAAPVAGLVLLALAYVTGSAAGPVGGEAADDLRAHAAVGRFSVVSEAGGAVWAFDPDGRLVVLGPGDLVARGTWEAGPGASDLDAQLAVAVTGQHLQVMAAVSPDGARLALYIEAGEPAAPEDGAPWPNVSRLVAERVAMVPDAAPSPAPPERECRRPAWVDDSTVDWEPCPVSPSPDGQPGPSAGAAGPTPAPSMAHGSAASTALAISGTRDGVPVRPA